MTNAETAILGLIAERPRHGYELDQVIDERGMRSWTELGFSSIYFLLGKLERAGLVTALASPGVRGPGRKEYRPTPAGVAALEQATRTLLSNPARPWPFLLGLANAPALSADDLVAALQQRAAALQREVADLAAAAERAAPEWFVEAIFDYSQTLIEAERQWLDTLLTQLSKEEPMPTPNPASPRKAGQPRLIEQATLTMAVVHSVGDPDEVGPAVFPRLYGSVYPLKFALKKQGVAFTIAPIRARWGMGPDDFDLPRDQWRAAWAIPVPDGTTDLPTKKGILPAEIERWEYGTVAEILHVGAYADEGPTIDTLHAFIADQGLEPHGAHEEEYLTRPGSKIQKTVIRYQVRPREGS